MGLAAVKSPGDELFETMGAQDLNTRLKELMDGLSVKVFRTFNASITLDKELHRESTSNTVDEKKADYDLANREVGLTIYSRSRRRFLEPRRRFLEPRRCVRIRCRHQAASLGQQCIVSGAMAMHLQAG